MILYEIFTDQRLLKPHRRYLTATLYAFSSPTRSELELKNMGVKECHKIDGHLNLTIFRTIVQEYIGKKMRENARKHRN
jgi:hypothetical protein